MAERGQRPGWKKALLGCFVGVAAVGITVGVLAGVKPDIFRSNKSAQSSPNNTATLSDNEQSDKESAAPINKIIDSVTKAESPSTTVDTPSTTTVTPATPATPADKASNPLQGLSGALNPSGSSNAVNNLFQDYLSNKAASHAGACVPQNGADLFRMASDPTSCFLITLIPGVKYHIGTQEIKITSAKVILGNPLLMPVLDGSTAPRLFHVLPGGSLDLHWVITYMGMGEVIATIPVIRGGSVYVALGGKANFFGVIFTSAPPTSPPPVLISPDLSRAPRIFGGQVFVAGGITTFTLCHFWVLTPGVLFREVYVIGGDVLMIAGVAVFNGCTWTRSMLFINGLGFGYQLAVLGGVAVGSGVVLTINFLAIHASGAGILFALGAGVTIFSGASFNAYLATLAHFGSGIFIFTGAGVLVVTGATFAASIGVGIYAGTAIMTSVGGGTVTLTGVAQEFSAGVAYLTGAGLFNFLGAGSGVMVGVSMSRDVGVVAAYGTGGNYHVGAGDLIAIACPSTDNYGTAAVVLIGGDWFLGAGILVEIACPLAKDIGLLWGVFVGIDTFVGAGGAVVGYSPLVVNYGLGWVNTKHPPATQFFVAGQAVNPNVKNQTVFIDKYGVYDVDDDRKWDDYYDRRQVQAEADAQPTGSISFLDSHNQLNAGNVSSFIQQLQAVTGHGPTELDASYAFLDNNALCQTCGYQGDASKDFAGPSADQCSSANAGACQLGDMTVASADGSGAKALPQWILDTASVYDSANKELPVVDSEVVLGDFKIGCSAQGAAPASCITQDGLKDVLNKAFGNCARTNIMSSSGSAFPELAADQEAAAAAAPSTTNFTNSQTTTAFSIAAVTHGNSACADNVQAFLQNYQPATLQQQLQAAAPDGLTVDNSAATYDTTHAVPGRSFAQALKSVGATVAASASKGIVPSVVVTPNTQTLSLISLPPIKSSSPLPITVSGFFPGATVDLALTQQCLSIADGQSLGSFTPKTSAEESHDFAIPASLKPGTYSVKATQNNLNWCSQPFDVLAQ